MSELKEWHGEDISDINFTYPHKTQCPKCASEGGDKSGDNLHVYGLDDDGSSLGAYCFDEDTDVFTYNGIKKIKDLIGKQTRIVNGNAEWEEVVFRSYGFDEIYELEISSNMIKKTIKTTANHLWFVKNNEKCLRTDELKPRQYLIGGELPKKSFKLIKDAVAHGFVFGDGSLHWRGNSSAVPFYSKTKYAVYEYLKDADCVITVGVRKRDTEVMPNLTFRHDKYPFKSLPLLAESDDYLFSWLSGYFAADGCLHGTGSSILNSANKEHLEFVEKVCARLCIRTRKIKSQTRAEGKSFLRKGESTIYNIRFYTKDLPENFFIREAHKKPNVKYDRKAWKVLSVKKTGIIKEVYCCETSTQSFLLADYILTHNCFRCNFTVPSEEFLAEVGNSSFSGNFDKKGESMISKRDEEKLKEKSLTPEQLAEIYDKTSDSLTTKYRGLDAEVCKQLGVRWKYDDSGKVLEMWFPCHIYENGELKTVGYKIRKQNKVFDVKGYVGKLCLMGNQTNYVAETLLVVAGEIDLVTAVKALQNKVNGSGKYKSISCNIVTPLLGEPHIADDLKANYEWVNKHKKVVICTDDDKAGREALENIKKVLPSEKTFVVSLRHKDLNEYIDPRYNGGDSIADGNIKITQDVYWDSKPLEDFGVIGSDQLRQKARDRLTQDKIPFPKFLSGLAKHFTDGSMWTGEWVNLIAPTSVGKSSVTDAWMIDWSLNSPYRQAVMSYEAGAEDYGVKVSSLATGKAIFKIEGKENRIKFIDDNADIIDKLLITEDGLPRFDFIESLPTSVEKLKKQIMYLIKIRNIRVLWVDPILDLLAIAKGSKADYDDIILFFENVRTSHHVTIMSILHTRKSLSSGGNGSDGADVSEEDAYGGRELISKGTINITASRNKNAEDWVERNTTKLTIRKSRTDQVTGVHALLFYRAKANKLYPFEYAEEHDFWKHELSMKVEDIIIDDDVGFDLAIIGDEELGDDGDGEQIFEELSNSTVTLVDVPDW